MAHVDFSFEREQTATSWCAKHTKEAIEITKEIDIFDFGRMMVTTATQWDRISRHAEERALVIYRQNGGDTDDILIVHEIAKVMHEVGIPKATPAAAAKEAKKGKKTRGKRGTSKTAESEKSEEGGEK